mmetsp:Transcript_24269/g.78303  ORF Transcript_24269/g.78303 Transcript_24269/m.78303 type:complete len:205 (-) Transcript_24269:1128-1742(-)
MPGPSLPNAPGARTGDDLRRGSHESLPPDQRGLAAGLTSATRLLGVASRTLRNRHHGTLLRDSRVNADGVVKVGLGCAAFHGHGEALCHLARMWAANVEAHDPFVLELVANDLRIAAVVTAVGKRPLERLKVRVEDFNVILAVHLDRVLLRQADRTILERSEDGRRNVGVIHLCCLAAIQTIRQELPCLDSDGRKLSSSRRRRE